MIPTTKADLRRIVTEIIGAETLPRSEIEARFSDRMENARVPSDRWRHRVGELVGSLLNDLIVAGRAEALAVSNGGAHWRQIRG